MRAFGDSLGKQAVRTLWNTPLLKYLHRTYNMRFRYMGLPGVDLLDVKLWKDMIDEVVAFEIREKPDRNDPQDRRSITELRRNMQMLGIPGYAYFGSMEDVVILRQDYDGMEYKQDKLVTLYNLDFCDEITSKIETAQAGKQLLRFAAIRQILLDQHECYKQVKGAGLFLILLTIRDQMDIAKLSSLLSRASNHDAQSYIETCSSLKPLPATGWVQGTHSWALKAFIYDLLQHYLTAPNISAIFFPIVKYTGKTQLSSMLHCMVLCRFEEPQVHFPLYLPQNYLTSATSVRALDAQSLIWEPEPGETIGVKSTPDSEQWLKDLDPMILKGRGLKVRVPKVR